MVKNFASNIAFAMFNNILQLAISLGSGVLISRNLGTIGKGETFLAIQIFNFVSVIFSFGFGPAILFFLKNKSIPRKRVNSFIIWYGLTLAFFFTFCLLFFWKTISLHITENFNLIIITVIIGYLNILHSLLGYKLMADESGVKRWSIISSMSNAIYLILLFFFIQWKVMGVLYALLAGAISKLFILLFYTNKSDDEGYELFKTKDLKTLWIYGLKIFLSNLFLTSVFRVDTFFLSKLVKTSELGLYSVAVNVGELLLLLPSAIGVAFFPYLSGLSKQKQTESMCSAGRLCFLIGFFGIIGLSIFGYPFILIFFGKSFAKSYIPLLILLPGLMMMTINYSYTNYFSSIGKPLWVAYSFLVGLIVNVILNLWLIPIYGINGAALSSSITYTLITCIFIIKIKQLNMLSLKDFVFPKFSDFLYIKNQFEIYFNKK